MRPVLKWPWPIDANNVSKIYKPHTIAKTDLELNLDCFCSYCEVYSSDLEVEHVISQHQDPLLANDWHNFLQACGRCNGKDNKSNKRVNLQTTHFPHLNNTYLSFVYKEGGLIVVNPLLKGDSLIRATNLLDLMGLDKIPGNPKYPKLLDTDTRWRHRRTAWEWAKRHLSDYERNALTSQQVADFAKQRGFFSVWFTVFDAHPAVKELLISSFRGTSTSCFDPQNNFIPIPRNSNLAGDPI